MTTKARTLYDILQVSPTAEPAMIKAAHVLLSRRLEAQGDAPTLRLLNDAFATLKDPALRAAYDERIAEPAPPLPPPAAARPAATTPAWSRALRVVAALIVGYIAATMWHQRALTAMVLDHQAALAEKQAELSRLQMEQAERRQAASQARYATLEEQRAKERQAQQEARELAALRSRLDREASDYQRSRSREEEQREREAQRRVEQERAARAAEAQRNAMLAERRLAEDKQELDRLYRENYPQYR